MPKQFLLLLFYVSCLGLTACATVINGTSQQIGISSAPSGAVITIDSMKVGNTPFVASLGRKSEHFIKIELAGYQPFEIALTKSANGAVWGNILVGGLIGLTVDLITGGMYDLNPRDIRADLRPLGDSNMVAAASEAAVLINSKLFNAASDKVWPAILTTVKEFGLAVQEKDEAGGTLMTAEYKSQGSDLSKIANTDAKSAIECKETKVILQFAVQPSEQATTVQVLATIEGYFQSGIEPGEWQQYSSNKTVEGKYLSRIEALLK
ncbi:MAG: PEGA domain-containing protein [Rhizobacter sp.]|nr:PEGA domain-containing protein [Chlorobiales bacterium]